MLISDYLADAAKRWANADSEHEHMELLTEMRERCQATTELDLIEHLLFALDKEHERAEKAEARAERWFRTWRGKLEKRKKQNPPT